MRRLLGRLLLVAALGSGRALAADYLSGSWGAAWSPDNRWLAINWPNKNELFFISVDTGESCLLKGMGLRNLETSLLISAETASPTVLQRSRLPECKTIAGPGAGKLTLIEWSPDSQQAAYRFGKQGRAIFSVSEQRVVRELKPDDLLPWQKNDEWQVAFELVTPGTARPARYLVRVLRPDGTTVKELSFERPQELRLLSAVRFNDNSFLSTDKRFVLYPRESETGWQLLRESLSGNSPPRPVTDPSPDAPYEWRLTRDNRYLMVAERRALHVGALDQWDRAQQIPLPNQSIAAQWSPDGQFLAYVDKQTLSLVPRGAVAAVTVSTNCAPRCWGWRGNQLYFGNARTDQSNLFRVTPGTSLQPVEAVPMQTWQSAPSEVSLSPNGRRLVCLVNNIDGSGQAHWELCQFSLQRDEEWEKFVRRLDRPDLVVTNAAAWRQPVDPRQKAAWQLLAATVP